MERDLHVVIAFAKRTGDYAVLSQTDLSVIALTCQYELEVNGDKNVRSVPGERKGPASVKHTPKAKGKGKEKEKEGVEATTAVDATTEVPEESRDIKEDDSESDSDEETSASRIEEVTEAVAKVDLEEVSQAEAPAQPGWKDEQEDSDGGEWINPSNVSKHRSKDLGLVPAGGGSDQSPMAAACMTGDYAVQNVLLSMGLGLIGEQGKRINKVKSWVLRCHACFKYVHPSSFIPIY
jgi:RNA-binding protein NOB1